MLFSKKIRNQEGFWDIDPVDLKSQLDLGAQIQLIDVRRPDEYVGELGHIKGARLITLETEFIDELKKFSSDLPIVFICRSGVRSGKAALFAEARGLVDVYNLKGGMISWNNHKLPITV